MNPKFSSYSGIVYRKLNILSAHAQLVGITLSDCGSLHCIQKLSTTVKTKLLSGLPQREVGWVTASRPHHEAVHCLNPIIPSGSATYIEEAIASEFGLEVVRRLFDQHGVDKCTIPPDYLRARELASEIDKDIIKLGQRLREHAGALGRVTVEAIEEIYPDAPRWALLGSLEKFPRPVGRV